MWRIKIPSIKLTKKMLALDADARALELAIGRLQSDLPSAEKTFMLARWKKELEKKNTEYEKLYNKRKVVYI